MKKDHKILELSAYKSKRVIKQLELTFQKMNVLKEQICNLDALKIIDIKKAEKSEISRDFEGLKKEMDKRYGVEDSCLKSEVFEKIKSAIVREGVDKSDEEFIFVLVEKVADHYSMIVEHVKEWKI